VRFLRRFWGSQPAAEPAGPPPVDLHDGGERLEVVREDFASGKHSRVSLVRRADATLWIWKRPQDDSTAHQVAFRKDMKRAKTWRALGLSNIEVEWHPDQRSLLRTYVPGVLAFERIQQRGFWTDEAYAKDRRALAQLIVHAAAQRAYVTDLNPKNLIFDGTRWHVIDSGTIYFGESPEGTLQTYQQKIVKIWAKKMPREHRPFLQEFLQRLTLED
jgi:hypothetical protein